MAPVNSFLFLVVFGHAVSQGQIQLYEQDGLLVITNLDGTVVLERTDQIPAIAVSGRLLISAGFTAADDLNDFAVSEGEWEVPAGEGSDSPEGTIKFRWYPESLPSEPLKPTPRIELEYLR